MTPPRMDETVTLRLLHDVRAGRSDSLEQLLAGHRDYMRAIADLRLDPQMLARVDPSDVVQEAMLEASRRIDDYLARDPMPFHLWLRATTIEQILRLRRQHVDAECRSLAAEARLPEVSSQQMAQQLLGQSPGPMERALQKELVGAVQQALDTLSEGDREVIVMRHYEGLTINEIAQALAIEAKAASKRYGRALLRLNSALRAMGFSGPMP